MGLSPPSVCAQTSGMWRSGLATPPCSFGFTLGVPRTQKQSGRLGNEVAGLLRTPREEPAKSQDITSAVLQNPLVTKIRMHHILGLDEESDSARQSETAPSCPSGMCALATRLCLIQKHQEMWGKKTDQFFVLLYTPRAAVKPSKEAELCPRLEKESTD